MSKSRKRWEIMCYTEVKDALEGGLHEGKKT